MDTHGMFAVHVQPMFLRQRFEANRALGVRAVVVHLYFLELLVLCRQIVALSFRAGQLRLKPRVFRAQALDVQLGTLITHGCRATAWFGTGSGALV